VQHSKFRRITGLVNLSLRPPASAIHFRSRFSRKRKQRDNQHGATLSRDLKLDGGAGLRDAKMQAGHAIWITSLVLEGREGVFVLGDAFFGARA
jgi:hypothetical protein